MNFSRRSGVPFVPSQIAHPVGAVVPFHIIIIPVANPDGGKIGGGTVSVTTPVPPAGLIVILALPATICVTPSAAASKT